MLIVATRLTVGTGRSPGLGRLTARRGTGTSMSLSELPKGL
jgi:hypothetical protein